MGVDYEMMEAILTMDAVQFEAVQTVLQSFTAGITADIAAGEPVPDKYSDYVDTIKTLNFMFRNPVKAWDDDDISRIASVTLNCFLGIESNDPLSEKWIEDGCN